MACLAGEVRVAVTQNAHDTGFMRLPLFFFFFSLLPPASFLAAAREREMIKYITPQPAKSSFLPFLVPLRVQLPQPSPASHIVVVFFFHVAGTVLSFSHEQR